LWYRFREFGVYFHAWHESYFLPIILIRCHDVILSGFPEGFSWNPELCCWVEKVGEKQDANWFNERKNIMKLQLVERTNGKSGTMKWKDDSGI
jgi:hypothetical protein